MNPNLKMNITLDPKQLIALLRSLRRPLTLMVVLGLIGYTGYQISKITSVQPDPIYTKNNEAKAKTPNLKIKPDTLTQLKNLRPAGDTSLPVATGKDDPFRL